eukprot:11155330-Lingulodinium_polyedra.AAC.1
MVLRPAQHRPAEVQREADGSGDQPDDAEGRQPPREFPDEPAGEGGEAGQGGQPEQLKRRRPRSHRV